MRMLSLARAHVVVGAYAEEEISRISRMFSQTGREDFWGVELSTKQKSTTWPEDDDEEESEDDIEQTLFLHHACLGQGAKDNDINIVSLTTYDGDDKKVTLPIAWLTTKTPQVSMRLPLRPPVKLELTEGSGPVAICGIHEMVLTGPDDFSDEDDDDDQKLEVESPEMKAIKGKEKEGLKVSQKRKAESQVVESAKKTAKKRKQTEVIEEESDDDDDDDDDEEMDDEDLRNYLNKVKGSFNGMADDENDEDEDEDDDDDDGDEDEDDEDDEEDDDEDEESEEEEPKKKISKGQKGKPTQVKQKTQTPKQEQKPKTPQTTGKKTKTVTPAKTTPASGGKSGQVAKTISEVKAKLLQSPNLPKKVDKFNNYIKHTFKIDDAGVQKQLWEFVQKKK